MKANPNRSEVAIAATVAASLALKELDHLKALECLPTPKALMERLQARKDNFKMLVGVVTVYLRGQERRRG